MSLPPDAPRAPRPGPTRLRAWDAGAPAASVLAAVLSFLTPVPGREGLLLRLIATALAAGLIVQAVRRWRTRPRAQDLASLWRDEHQFRLFAERLPVVTYIEPCDPHDDRVFMSPRVQELLGWPPTRWSSVDRWDDMIHADDRDRVDAENERSMRNGDPFAAEYRMYRADGSLAWVRDEAALVRSAEGRPLYWQGVLLDITEGKTAELQLREAEERYRALVEHMPAVTYIEAQDPENPLRTRPVYVSPQLETMLGYAQQEWITDPDLWARSLHPEDRERMVADDLRITTTGDPLSAEYRILTKAGRVTWVHDECVPVRDEAGRVQFWQGVMFDVTERKEAQRGLERALTRERDATRALREIDAMKNTFLHAVSHELRTPLASILGFAVTLEHHRGTLPAEETQELTKRLAVNARKLDRLLSDLLDLDRLDRGIIEPNWRPTDVGALVRHAVQESDLVVERNLHIEADPVLVSVDGAKVERIVENLLANTARHTPADTPIWIWVRAHDRGVLIVVEDAGPGVPAELRETIFRPFEQGPERSAHSPGVGIGLSLVGRFAKLHGGRAWVEDRPGGGASFRVWLPDGPVSGLRPGTASHPTGGRATDPEPPEARAASA
jgi:PAS domain S-box-containing protein